MSNVKINTIASDEIVIARFREDLDWIGGIPDQYAVLVYNKGAPIASRKARNRADHIIDLENSGRESDTILRHILAKQNFSRGFTVFLQGDPFEHSPDILALLDTRDRWDDIQPLSWRWLAAEQLPPPAVLDYAKDEYVGALRVRSELFSLMTWTQLHFADRGAKAVSEAYRGLHDLPDGVNIGGHFLRSCKLPSLAEHAEKNLIGRFSYGALFGVRQTLLQQVPPGSLERALKAANGHHIYGYILERLWLHMFGEPFLLATPSAIRNGAPSGPTDFAGPMIRPPLHHRVVPGLKRRLLAWAEN